MLIVLYVHNQDFVSVLYNTTLKSALYSYFSHGCDNTLHQLFKGGEISFVL